MKIQYNECKYCGAKDGRAGNLYSIPTLGVEMACQNCWDTINEGNVVIHTHLVRTEEELKKTMTILVNI
jgi:hypothetical protein